ncbi:MAG: alpha-2-macroglobulin [Thermodesulfovibrio sp.]|nr:alpha-2-macroglobulin [Thermodesulfovibrio sp.]
MKYSTISCAAIAFLLLASAGFAEEYASVNFFSPQGTIKNVRQVSARFSVPMVAFGDPGISDPFVAACPEKGRGRWVDSSNWVYDFDRDLPAGISCEFTLKKDLRSVSGLTLAGPQTYSFSTGGPAVLRAFPREASEEIDEDQIFVLELDAEADEASLLAHVACEIDGVMERVGIRIVKDPVRAEILQQYRFLKDRPVTLLQCTQRFPAKAKVHLVWGKGVATTGGVMTAVDRRIEFRARAPFTAEFSCSRENARSACIPVLPLRLNFSSPIPWEVARKIQLRGGNKNYKAAKPARGDEGEEGGDELPAEDDNYVSAVVFKGPFPENGVFTLELPKEVKDEAGRPLANRNNFPLTVKTAANPPLAKFAARFGIIELKGDATLPVTIRNIEPEVRTRMHRVEKPVEGAVDKTREAVLDKTRAVGEAIGSVLPESLKGKNQDMVDGLKGRLHKLRMGSEEQLIEWLKAVAAAKREKSIFSREKDLKPFSVPKPGGAQAFEVIGLPLKGPGLYVVEMESQLLGRSLLGKQAPMFVQTAALVTNLSAHFKWGMESSLVWVTTLDKGEPVKEAAVSLRDCNGKQLWRGKTDQDGIARILKQLPSERDLPACSSGVNYEEATQALRGINRGLFVFATSGADMTFVHSGWDEGIEPWRYNMPDNGENAPVVAHTILDRSLLRAGDTVHMKHLFRRHTTSGLSLASAGTLPGSVLIRHAGSDQQYEMLLVWDKKGAAESQWVIPKEASLGSYSITLLRKKGNSKKNRKKEEGDYPEGWESGSFRVEEFRVPLMKAVLLPQKEALVKVTEAEVDIQLSYLSGGGVKNAAVKLRSQTMPKYINFADYEDFVFTNGAVREEKTRRSRAHEGEDAERSLRPKTQTTELILDGSGGLRTKLSGLPEVEQPHDILAELEFRDPNGETQTVSRRIPLWPARVLVGIKPDSWAASKDDFRFHVVVVDLDGRPVSERPVKVDLFQKKAYSHRKRLVGGFYAYEHTSETKKTGRICEGKTDSRGLLICEAKSPVSGNVILQAEAADDAGNASRVHRDVWIVGKGDWWFDVADHDRIDLIPEKKRYEPGETAKFQVRMPFREATALISIEREGIVDTYVRKLSGKHPVIEVPVRAAYAPNIFVSALVVRGRVAGVQPTALVDLGKPAFRLGLGEIQVGRKAFELKVEVVADRQVYKVRDKARVRVQVKRANGKKLPKGSEVALAAIDEGLLELMSNKSWNLIEGMMGRRDYRVRTATAQMQVVGKRHYGLKAQPQGGGGGRQTTRELFDTLLFWKAKVALNEKGEAEVEVPLNDSLTGFRIVAVATGGAELFGTGQTSIRTAQDLMLLSSLPPVVREGDSLFSGFTVRNASNRSMDIEVKALLQGIEKKELDPLMLTLAAGGAQEIGWKINVPVGAANLTYEVTASEKGGDGRDIIRMKQRVAETVPVRTFQATITQVDGRYQLDLEKPQAALSGKGGISVSLRPRIADSLSGVTLYMKKYPYTCMEQKVSRAVSLRDEALWKTVISELPAHLDGDGLVKYFPLLTHGSDALTAYIVSIAHEAGWVIPEDLLFRMEEGLKGFVEGRVIRYSSLPAADLSIRKLAALAALARLGKAEVKQLGSISLEPNLWPTSALLDWTDLLLRMKEIPGRDKKITEAEQMLRSRMNFQGTTLGFSTERSDRLWWLMVSPDLNAVKSILTLLPLEHWKQDMPRLLRAALGRQHRGSWDLTTANAWGVLAVEKFSKQFEATAVTGLTTVTLGDSSKNRNWAEKAAGADLKFGWPKDRERMTINHAGTGRPWAMVQSLAAIPLKGPFASGYRIKKTLVPVEQKTPGIWTKGDVLRVRLEVEAQADMTWVVLNDPIPAGSMILGTGLGRDSQIMTTGEQHSRSVWPAFEERSFEAFRSYYEFVPKGSWTAEYTVRLNNSGTFRLPSTRVEAMYAPEAFGEIPNEAMEVGQ